MSDHLRLLIKVTGAWLLLAGCMLTVRAQQQIFFRNYSVMEGLCSNTVWCIQQDDQGYMWFGTKNGLSRFDGYEFRSFQFNKDVRGTLGNNFIHVICRYDSTTYWIGTEKGIYILDQKKAKFSIFKPTGRNVIFDIMKDGKGRFWVATRGSGLFSYDPRTGKVENYRAGDKKGGISANHIRNLTEDHRGNIWIGTFGKGIDVLDPASGTFRNYRGKGSGLASNHILSLYTGLDGSIWAGTLKGGLSVFQPEKGGFKTYTNAGPNSINDNIVRAIYQPGPGKLYIGTEKGLVVLDIERERFTAWQTDVSDPRSISDNAVYSIFQDREGGMWIGTYFGGVNYFQEKDTGFELYYPTGRENSLSGAAVSCFLEDEPGKFWIGTEDGGLNYFNSFDRSFKRYPFRSGQEKLSYHNIHSLFKDSKGRIWIGMFTGGLNIYDPATGRIRRYLHDPQDPHSLSNNSVYTIYEDREHRIWVGTVKGLNLYDPAADRFIRITERNLDGNCIHDIYQDGRGVLWVATYDNGLFCKDGQNGKWKVFQAGMNSLSSNKVISLLDDGAGSLWIGTDGGGLNRYSFSDSTFRVYGREQGITGNVIYGILRDDQGALWITTNQGLFRLDPGSGDVKHYTTWDGLQSPQFNYNAYLKANNGKLYIGGVKGFNAFFPDSIRVTAPRQQVALTNFQLFNKNISFGEKNSPLDKPINLTGSLTLSHKQSVISFEYSALSFIAPGKIFYAYKMEGFDKSWNYVGRQRKATYTNLPAGEYVFRVKAGSGTRGLDIPETSIRLVIRPPFYRTTVAYIVYVLLFLAAFVASRGYLLRQARKKNEIRLERLKNKKEQEFYKQKIEFFTGMAHEIRTPLSLIMAPLEKLIGSGRLSAEERKQLEVMDENSARLSTLVNQLLDFRRIESDIYEICREETEIVSLVHSVYARFSAISWQKGLDFTFSTRVNRLAVLADPEALTKILNNLLINAVKFTRTTIRLSIDQPVSEPSGEWFISISVEDDGIGIPPSEIGHIFDKFFKVSAGAHQYNNIGGTGIGLSLARALAEKHGGKLLVSSEENVKTVFNVRLPYEPVDAAGRRGAVSGPQGQDGGEEKAPDSAPGTAAASILVVEDDVSMLDFISESLVAENYRVLTADNGSRALELLEKNEVDLVISDLMMPEISGMELCRRIKTNIDSCHVPFVLLTARSNSDAEIAGIENGADSYITKPFKWKHVLAVVKNLLDSRDLLRRKFSEQPFVIAGSLTTNTHDRKFMEKLMNIIRERMADPQLSVEELGKDMAMSRSSLHKKLKSLSGYVPNEFIRLVRLKHAAALLLSGEHTISAIGYMTGFNSPSYFTKCFCRQFRMTPSDFVERHAAAEIKQSSFDLKLP